MLQEMQQISEKTYEVLNNTFYQGELPKVILTIQSSPKTYGHFTVSPVWKAEEERYHEINLSAEHLDRAFENIAATIAHEMCHLYAKIKGIADTSKDGRYHNKNFRDIAENHGIHVEYVKYIGYSKTTPSEQLKQVIEEYRLGKPMELNRGTEVNYVGGSGGNDSTNGLSGGNRKKKSSTRNWMCPSCGNKCRTTKDISIICGECMEEFKRLGE
ncbi:SprT-like domain-containing protein [Candidatus Galacturonibacter soehngenii]|uniref:SprT family zinc-dependent metalloprotease n=1 Tax=Candidatus Galacturonatibacter soehngenii TaxID=2307010 RepID=A0A7V7UCI2_9FIRM|nr:SprT-like domain-containing protein [Candidatus Galacturonibacter soehngenii]KAB1438694.1 SprT family zinc-dependent metalloprotease [Candidatus Galacturonibacter soehngenii]